MLIRDGGVIAPGYDAELDQLRDLTDNADKFLLDLEKRERDTHRTSQFKSRLQSSPWLLSLS